MSLYYNQVNQVPYRLVFCHITTDSRSKGHDRERFEKPCKAVLVQQQYSNIMILGINCANHSSSMENMLWCARKLRNGPVSICHASLVYACACPSGIWRPCSRVELNGVLAKRKSAASRLLVRSNGDSGAWHSRFAGMSDMLCRHRSWRWWMFLHLLAGHFPKT